MTADGTSMPAPAPQRKHTRWLWAIGIALYLGILWYIGWRRIGAALAQIDPRFLAGVAGVELGALALRLFKWRIVLRGVEHVPALFFLSKAAGSTSPARLGELAPLLLKRHRTARMGAWLVVDRLLEMSSTLGLGALALIILQLPTRGLLPAVALAVLLLVAAPALLLTRRGPLEWTANRFPDGGRVQQLCLALVSLSGEIRALKTWIPAASALTLAATSLDIAVSILLYGAFGCGVSFLIVAVAKCAHGVTTAVPFLPNATGVPYLVAAGVLYEFAEVPEAVLAAAVAVRTAVTSAVLWACFGLTSARMLKQEAFKEETDCSGAACFERMAAQGQLYDYPAEDLARLRQTLHVEGRLLDIGCGDGLLTKTLDADWAVGIEQSPGCAALALKRGAAAVVATASAPLPFADTSFDTVTCINVLHHLHAHWPLIFAEADRVLRPGGRLLIVEPDARNPCVRWTQAPNSPLRVVPCNDEPAIYPTDLLALLEQRAYDASCGPIDVYGQQTIPSPFPLWQRALKAPFVITLAWYARRMPLKFFIEARKPEA